MRQNLEASIEIDATPAQVWSVVGDLERMPEFSPQCFRTKVFGEPRAGALMLNLNRQGWKFWPTTANIVRYEPDSAVAFRVRTNHMVWSYELSPSTSGTKVVERRQVGDTVAKAAHTVQLVALGSDDDFDARLVTGMNETLAKIKKAVEAGPVA